VIDAQRNPERASEQISSSAGEHAHEHVTAGERTCDFHDRSVTAEREHGVVAVPMFTRELRGMSGTLGVNDLTRNRTARQRLSCTLGEPFPAA